MTRLIAPMVTVAKLSVKTTESRSNPDRLPSGVDIKIVTRLDDRHGPSGC